MRLKTETKDGEDTQNTSNVGIPITASAIVKAICAGDKVDCFDDDEDDVA